MTKLLRRFWPHSLAGQLVLFLLVAMIVAQAIAFAIVTDERRIAVERSARDQIVARTVDVARLIVETPPDAHMRMMRSTSDRRLRFEISESSLLERADRDERESAIEDRIAVELGALAREVRVSYETEPFARWFRTAREERERRESRTGAQRGDSMRDQSVREGPPPMRDFVGLAISINLANGRWLNMRTLVRTQPPTFEGLAMMSILVTGVVLVVIVIFTVRRTTRPLRALAGAAERLGRGEPVAPLVEEGPSDVRQTIAAFNGMQDRLKRFVDDRTRMLAAISHDLRTPITSLRLRAELVDDADARAAMMATLAEMQAMVEETLAFAKDEAASEATRSVDLAALLDSLCDDLAAMGKDVGFSESDRLPLSCRPAALRRAFANLIENAVAYGERARVSLARVGHMAEVCIDDDGLGIPDADRTRVFEPFVRLEASRSRETGGIGLGLSIARTIVHAHGGEIELANRAEGGLRATVRLPLADGTQG